MEKETRREWCRKKLAATCTSEQIPLELGTEQTSLILATVHVVTGRKKENTATEAHKETV